MKKTVIIQFKIPGFHNYPNAPEEVDFLSYPHRHTFTIKAGFGVDDLNREKEIFLETAKIEKYLIEKYGLPCIFGDMSCEMIALNIMGEFNSYNMTFCEVWEEETGGARIEK